MANFEMLGRSRRTIHTIGKDAIDNVTNLGRFLKEIGRSHEASILQQLVLNVMEKGKDAEYTTIAMHDLAITLISQGHLHRARPLLRKVVEFRKETSGENHVLTIEAMLDLAKSLKGCSTAIEKSREVVDKSQRFLAADDTVTLGAMDNLAHAHRDRGEYLEAIRIQEDVLKKIKQFFGDESSETIGTMGSLANMLLALGKQDEAIQMQSDMLVRSIRVLKKEHPHTIKANNMLATMLGEQARVRGDHDQLREVEKMKREGLEDTERIFGEWHPDTFGAIYSLTNTIALLGNYDEAITRLKTTAQRMECMYEDGHTALELIKTYLEELLEQRDGDVPPDWTQEMMPVFF